MVYILIVLSTIVSSFYVLAGKVAEKYRPSQRICAKKSFTQARREMRAMESVPLWKG
jgi:hypothetical protein